MKETKCPKCGAKMHGVTKIILGGKNKHLKECPKCNYRTEAK